MPCRLLRDLTSLARASPTAAAVVALTATVSPGAAAPHASAAVSAAALAVLTVHA